MIYLFRHVTRGDVRFAHLPRVTRSLGSQPVFIKAECASGASRFEGKTKTFLGRGECRLQQGYGQQEYLSLEGYTVRKPGQSPGIADGKKRLAWKAVRPRRWQREPL